MNSNTTSEKTFRNFDLESNQSEKQSQFQGVYNLNLQRNLRHRFIQKVYGILFAQLALTTFLCFLSMTIPSVQQFQQETRWLFWLLLCFSFIVIFILFVFIHQKIVLSIACFNQVGRLVPTNYILLFAFTFCEGYLVSSICSFYKASIVLIAALLTTVIVLALTVSVYFTKTNLTIIRQLLSACLGLFICFWIIALFVHIKILHLIFCACGVLLFSIYLIYDTRLVLQQFGEMYSIDDYIIAALQLYLDIINIFLYILSILANSN